MVASFCSLLDLTNSLFMKRPTGWDHFFPFGAVSSTSIVSLRMGVGMGMGVRCEEDKCAARGTQLLLKTEARDDLNCSSRYCFGAKDDNRARRVIGKRTYCR